MLCHPRRRTISPTLTVFCHILADTYVLSGKDEKLCEKADGSGLAQIVHSHDIHILLHQKGDPYIPIVYTYTLHIHR